MKTEIKELIKKYAPLFNLNEAVLAAFIEVETGGQGFDPGTGKIIIQFEPSWFRKKAPYAPSGSWSLNKVDVQSKEWIAFNEAFRLNPTAAMESTSIGLGQVMGYHWKRLGYNSVGEMWDDAKRGLDRQVLQICNFINTDIKLISALKARDWDRVASIYNGSGYKELAKKYNREPYDISLQKAFNKYSKTPL